MDMYLCESMLSLICICVGIFMSNMYLCEHTHVEYVRHDGEYICKRAQEKRLYSAKETYNFKEPYYLNMHTEYI